MVANIRSAAVVEALATVPREEFLPPGPWTVRSDSDLGGPPRQTPDADPRHVYSPKGRIVLPVTATMGPMGNIGKGLLLLLTRTPDPDVLDVRPLTFVAIFSAFGLRDDALNAEIGRALAKHPFPPLRRLRRDAHERSDSCWLHGPAFCLSLTAN